MKELVAKINAEYEVFAANAAAQVEKGNKAAGTRVRKVMQDVRAAAQELRGAILEVRDAGAAPGGTPPKA